MSTSPPATQVTMPVPENWDNRDANGYYVKSSTWQPHDMNGHDIHVGDIILVACPWLMSNIMQSAQVIQADGQTPIRVKSLRAIRQTGRAAHQNFDSKRTLPDGTFYISNMNILYQSDQYRNISPDFTAALLYPRGQE